MYMLYISYFKNETWQAGRKPNDFCKPYLGFKGSIFGIK